MKIALEYGHGREPYEGESLTITTNGVVVSGNKLLGEFQLRHGQLRLVDPGGREIAWIGTEPDELSSAARVLIGRMVARTEDLEAVQMDAAKQKGDVYDDSVPPGEQVTADGDVWDEVRAAFPLVPMLGSELDDGGD